MYRGDWLIPMFLETSWPPWSRPSTIPSTPDHGLHGRLTQRASRHGLRLTRGQIRHPGVEPGKHLAILDRIQDLEIKTLMDASAVASRLLGFYKIDRGVFRVKLKTQPFALELGNTVRVTYPRFGLVSGKDLRVIGLAEDAGINEVELKLWG